MFDVFPGAPAVTDWLIIAFKGNYTVDGIGKTGVYYRELSDESAGGTNPVKLIANNTDSLIPGTTTVFGSTAPPSAANRQMVFAGFDDEWDPNFGGIYLAPLDGTPQPPLTTLVSIGEKVPGESGNKATFTNLGEGVAFDGRYVGFWGAWGQQTRTVRLYCPMEGNRDRIAYCNQELVCADSDETIGDPNSVCDDTADPNYGISCYQDKPVPVNQGIFVHDTAAPRGGTRAVAKTGARFDEFLFWNYSGRTPCVGRGHHSEEGAEDDGEAARWRSSAFVAVSGQATAFKAVASGGDQGACGSCHSGGGVGSAPPTPSHARLTGIYLGQQPGQAIVTVLDTRTDGQALDPEAPAGSTVTELGIEREGLRGNWIAISAKMGTEEDGMAGVYLTTLPPRE
jgi:cytochrome c553